MERNAQVPVSEPFSSADHNPHTKWDVKLPCVKIPFGSVGLGKLSPIESVTSSNLERKRRSCSNKSF